MSTQVEFVVQFKSAALHCKCAVSVSLHFFPNEILIFVKQFKITRVVMSILLLNIVKYTFLQEGSGFESSGLAGSCCACGGSLWESRVLRRPEA